MNGNAYELIVKNKRVLVEKYRIFRLVKFMYSCTFSTKNPFPFIQTNMGGICMFTIKITDTNDPNCQWIGSDTESVLDGAQKNGVKIPYACKGGGCGLCKVRVEEGEFERGRSSTAVLPNDERILNYTLACKTYPKSNMKVQLDMSRQKEYMGN